MSVRRVSNLGSVLLGPGLIALLAAGCGDNHHGQADAFSPSDGMADAGDAAPRVDGAGEGGETARADGPTGDLADVAADLTAADLAAEVAPDAAGEARADGAGDEVGPGCNDGVRNRDEADVDCGGPCGRCAIGRACRAGADCASGACNAGHICVECLTAANCPGQDAECSVRACVGGACLFGVLPAGTVLAVQTNGDCRSRRCDGFGQVAPVTDDTDLPEDGNPCTREVCSAGVPSNPPTAAATTCGAGRLCDGAGHCVGCLTAGDCPGTDDECKTRSCVQNLCGFIFRASGTAVATQVAGDCKSNRCDGAGHVQPASDDSDLPADGNACTDDLCASGVPSNPNRPIGTACLGGNHCDSAGRCVSCLVAADCPGQDTPCRRRTCVQGVCGADMLANGTPVVAQTPGDCKVLRCGAGGVAVSEADNADLPVDGNACTSDVCTAGVASNPPLAVMTACGGSNQCDGAGHCVGCLVAADCPGDDTVCQTRTCDANLMICGLDNVPDGTAAGTQVAGDCRTSVCNGNGALGTKIDDADVRVDGNPCTQDLCSQGTASNPFSDAGVSCPTGVCDGQGHCVACVTNADCGTNNACATYTCAPDHTCSHVFVGAGTAIATQTAGDCKVVQCNGNGATVTVADGNDVNDDGNSCTDDVCLVQTPEVRVPAHPPKAAGTGCGGTSVCDGAGQCGPAAVDGGADGGDGDGADAAADVAAGNCPAPYVFCDDFEDGDAAGWTGIEQAAAGSWVVGGEIGHAGVSTFDFQGSIDGTSDGGTDAGVSTSFHYQSAAVAASGGPWTDQTVSAWIKPTVASFGADGNKPGLCARFSGATYGTSTGYCVFIRSDGSGTRGKLQVSKKTTSTISSPFTSSNSNLPDAGVAAPTIPQFVANNWYKVALQASGSTTVTLRVFVNDVLLVELTDATAPVFTSGGPALVIRGANANYDDLRVSVP